MTWTRPSPYQPLSLSRYSSRPMDFAAIDDAWMAAGHSNEACGGWKYEPHTDPAKSLIRCACESVIPLPLEVVMGGEQPRAAAA